MTALIPCEIQDVAYRGRGVARVNGKAVFIPGVIRGEQVTAVITREHKQYAEAKLAEVIEPSAERRLPFCRYYEECPGCCYQHMTYNEELRTKNTQLTSLLRHVPNIEQSVFSPPVPSPRDRGYRNRITLHRIHTEGEIITGYIAQDNHTVIPIEECPLADPQINDYLKNMLCETAHSTSRIQLRKTNAGVTVVCDTDTSNPGIHEHSAVIGVLQTSVKSFYQVNNTLADLLFQHVSQLIEYCKPDSVFDLYCGVGVFALLAGRVCNGPVTGIDSDTEAIAYARRNAALHDLTHIRFEARNVTRALQQLPSNKGQNDLWIIDPPRAGLHKTARQQILSKKPKHILYISCAPDTLARDLQALCQTHYQVKQVRLFDMFPRTYCFETVTFLERSV